MARRTFGSSCRTNDSIVSGWIVTGIKTGPKIKANWDNGMCLVDRSALSVRDTSAPKTSGKIVVQDNQVGRTFPGMAKDWLTLQQYFGLKTLIGQVLGQQTSDV
jgi:hypothetical protein